MVGEKTLLSDLKENVKKYRETLYAWNNRGYKTKKIFYKYEWNINGTFIWIETIYARLSLREQCEIIAEKHCRKFKITKEKFFEVLFNFFNKLFNRNKKNIF